MVRPMAILVDQPGGPLDALAGHPDVATFLNDRFHPWFLPPAIAGRAAPVTLLLDEDGCLLAAPVTETEATAWLQAVNAAALARADPGPSPIDGTAAPAGPGSSEAGRVGARPDLAVSLDELGADHPLRRPCPTAEGDGP